MSSELQHDEDLLEQLYWEMDTQRKKTGDERLAFKGKLRFYANAIHSHPSNITKVTPVSDWYQSIADLSAIYGEICAINETPTKYQTAEQIARLKVLRQQCVAAHYNRIELVRKNNDD